MPVHRTLVRSGAVLGGTLTLLVLAAPPAPAHPLGNFSVNHYVGLTVHADGIDALAVTDLAEIPTLQEQSQADPGHTGSTARAELAARAGRQCAETAQRLRLTPAPGGDAVRWTVTDASFGYQDGTAGLPTSRLECRLHATARITAGGSTFHLATGADPTRVGWNEITARGDGASIVRSDVPPESVSRELRDYPRELLDSPRGVTEATFVATPGGGSATVGARVSPAGGGPSAWLAGLDSRLARMGTAHRLTWPIGLMAVLLSIVLGAGHALLPGHGKTVMAAYLAGRRGRRRDAVTVGATVTLTHTAGVLITGLLLTASSSLAGDTLLGWLGVTSGALVVLVGAGLLRDAVGPTRSRPRPRPAPAAPQAAHPALVAAGSHPAGHHTVHSHGPDATGGPAAHGHDNPHHDHGDHDPSHGDHDPSHEDHDHGHRDHDHRHAHHSCGHARHSHDHGDHDHEDHGHGHEPQSPDRRRPEVPHQHHGHTHAPHRHRHGVFGHSHSHGHGHHEPAAQAPGRRTLIGLGIAGGLVPSPSALVVLLGAVALGRTLFGAGLVLAYGLGMAATLTGAGLLLVGLGDRLTSPAHARTTARLRRLAPYSGRLTALLVLTVGLGMVLRSLPTVL